MSDKVPIEVTTRYATSVDELTDAWAFVMDRLEKVGPDPRVTVSPTWTFHVSDIDTEQRPPRRFEVVVEGTVTE